MLRQAFNTGLEARMWQYELDLALMKYSRNIRFSTIYPRLEDHGAYFGQIMGYERPLYLTKCPDRSAPADEDGTAWYFDRASRLGSRGDPACRSC